MANQIQCPSCKGRFPGVTITDCAVECPGCGHAMIVYRRTEAPITRGMLWAMCDSERALLVKAVRPWMPPEHVDAAAVLVGVLFSKIADTLPEG